MRPTKLILLLKENVRVLKEETRQVKIRFNKFGAAPLSLIEKVYSFGLESQV